MSFSNVKRDFFCLVEVYIKMPINGVSKGRQYNLVSLSPLLCEMSSCSVARWTLQVRELDTEGDTGGAVSLKAFGQQTIPDAETLPSSYLPDRACWPARELNQSPTEANKSKKMLIEA